MKLDVLLVIPARPPGMVEVQKTQERFSARNPGLFQAPHGCRIKSGMTEGPL